MKDTPVSDTDLKALSESKHNLKLYLFSHPDGAVLERFKKPEGKAVLQLHIVSNEFTCLCPITGQPDFAEIEINYIPDEWCVESKALKLYLMGFRNYGTFHEACVQQIANDLIELLDPKQLEVIGRFTPRGGLPFHPTATYYKGISASLAAGPNNKTT